MRYKVPQNIDMPDRIMGPLTMIQFVEAVLGGGLAYVCYNAFPNPLNIFFAAIVGLFTVCVVLVKINERPFLFYFVALIKFFSTPKQRTWQKDAGDGFEVEMYKADKSTGLTIAHRNLDKKNLAEIARQIDNKEIKDFRIEQK